MHRRTVLQIIPELETGGAERTAVDIAAALTARGDRAIILSEGGRLVEELTAAGGEHRHFPARTKNPLKIVANAFRLKRLIEQEKIDVIHARSRAPAWSALIAARMAKIPFVTTYHGIYNQKSGAKALYNSVMARGDAVIANSRYTAALIAERHPFASEKIVIIHRGTDLDGYAREAVPEARLDALRQAWGIAKGETVILNVARLTAWKGQRVLIDALARLSQQGNGEWTAILAGSDQGRAGYREELQERIAQAGLQSRVRLVGHCDDIAAAHALAAVAVVASTDPEAFGRAAVEAQAAGVPVIVTDIGAAAETVLAPPEVDEGERTGWRIEPGDPQALCDSLLLIAAMDGQERNRLAARAVRHVKRHFSKDAMAAATLAVYDRLTGKSPQDNAKAAAARRGKAQPS